MHSYTNLCLTLLLLTNDFIHQSPFALPVPRRLFCAPLPVGGAVYVVPTLPALLGCCSYGADLVPSSAGGDNASVSLFGSNIAGCSVSACGSEECVEGDLGVYCSCYTSVVDKTSVS